MDAIVFGKTGIPDLRFDTYNNPVAEIFAPEWTRKSWIKKKLSGENPYEEYDNPQYLCNMYMEKPDWDQPHMKMFYSFVAGVNLAFFSGCLEILNMKSKQPQKAMWIAGKNLFFMGSSALTYGAVTCAVANLRGKKDDIWNHAAGGASLGFICGFSMKSSASGTMMGIAGAIGGMLFKAYYQDEGRPGIKAFYNGPRELRLIQGYDFYDLRTQNYYAHTMFNKQRSEHYNL